MATSDTITMTDRHLEYSNWVDMWSIDDINFHKPMPDPIYKNGFSVVGVDIAEKAVSSFFIEHKLEPFVETIKNVGKIYRTKDDRIQLFVANIFDLSSDMLMKFDVIWDIAGYCVINKVDRSKYVEFIKWLMLPTSKYIICGPDYDKTVFPGPPHPTNLETLAEYFGQDFNIEEIHVDDIKMGLLKKRESIAEAKSSNPESQDSKLNYTVGAAVAVSYSPYAYFRYMALTLK